MFTLASVDAVVDTSTAHVVSLAVSASECVGLVNAEPVVVTVWPCAASLKTTLEPPNHFHDRPHTAAALPIGDLRSVDYRYRYVASPAARASRR